MKDIFKTLIIFSVYLSAGCAQTGDALTGGDKDTVPPKVIYTKPKNMNTLFNQNKIVFAFDEFVITENIEDNFMSSPFIDKKPAFKIKRKKLIVNLKQQLLDSATYIFNINNSVKDFHELNLLPNLQYVFSTASYIDTLEISGQIIDAFTFLPEKDMFVFLYTEFADSLPLSNNPYYITKTDSSGYFKFDYIKPAKYKMFALADADNNFRFNLPNEKIAFADSAVFPTVEQIVKTDSLKKGTILHLPDNSTDTLKSDTIIVSYKNIYKPADIKLYSFYEDKIKQFVVNYERTDKGRCFFEFNKPVDSLIIQGKNFTLDSNSAYIVYTDTGKTASVFIKDPKIFNDDTVAFDITVYNRDSLENTFPEKTTISLTNKKNNANADSTTLTFEKPLPEHDYFKNFIINYQNPLARIDTSKIKLYYIIDTIVTDDKTQKLLTAQRRSPEIIFFAFKRPLVKQLNITINNITQNQNLYSLKYNNSRDTVICNITDKNIAADDTLNIKINYDNSYFFNQTQNFSDSLKLTVQKQRITQYERPQPDTIILSFIKPLSQNPQIIIDDMQTAGNFKHKISQNKLYISLNNKAVMQKDTLHIELKTADYSDSAQTIHYFEENFISVYVPKKQFIKKHGRKSKDEIYIKFNDRLKSAPRLTIIGQQYSENIFIRKTSENTDSVAFTVNQLNAAETDTLKIAVEYDIYNIKNEPKTIYDTLNFFVVTHKRTPKANKKNTTVANNKNLKNVKIEILQQSNVYINPNNPLQCIVQSNFIQDKEYKLKTDLNFASDIYGKHSAKADIEFKAASDKFYGGIILSVANVKRMQDPDYDKVPKKILDSLQYSNISEGQIILQLISDKNKIINQNFFKQDTTLTYQKLAPAKYNLRIIYDKNSDGKYNTGNYLKKQKPEPVIMFPDDIIIKSNWDNELNWKLILKN